MPVAEKETCSLETELDIFQNSNLHEESCAIDNTPSAPHFDVFTL